MSEVGTAPETARKSDLHAIYGLFVEPMCPQVSKNRGRFCVSYQMGRYLVMVGRDLGFVYKLGHVKEDGSLFGG